MSVYNMLPLGITCAQVLFQKCINTLLTNLKGVLFLMDDVLVYSKNQSGECDKRFEAVLKYRAAGMTLNRDKC